MAQTAKESQVTAAAALPCDETDALLQVKYNITIDKWLAHADLVYTPF